MEDIKYCRDCEEWVEPIYDTNWEPDGFTLVMEVDRECPICRGFNLCDVDEVNVDWDS